MAVVKVGRNGPECRSGAPEIHKIAFQLQFILFSDGTLDEPTGSHKRGPQRRSYILVNRATGS